MKITKCPNCGELETAAALPTENWDPGKNDEPSAKVKCTKCGIVSERMFELVTADKNINTALEREQKYLRNEGSKCPYCGEETIEGHGSVEIDNGRAWQKVGCTECENNWIDIYTLTGMQQDLFVFSVGYICLRGIDE